MTIKEFNRNNLRDAISNNINSRLNSDINQKAFLDPNLMPLLPKDEALAGFSEQSNILIPVAEQYKKMTDFITRKILQKKINFSFYNFTKKPNFYNQNIRRLYIENLNFHYTNYVGYIQENNIKIYNINDFYNNFLFYIRLVCSIQPLTLYNTLPVRRDYFENTGLSILLKQEGLNNDRKYISELTLSTSNIRQYVKVANLNGFEVDSSNFYRLVFNPYRRITEQDINKFYTDNFYNYYLLELNYLSTMVTVMYGEFVKTKFDNYQRKNTITIPDEYCNQIIKSIKKNVELTGDINQEQKLRLYGTAILSERGLYDDPARNDIMFNATNLMNSLDMFSAMQYIVAQARRLSNTTTITRTI